MKTDNELIAEFMGRDWKSEKKWIIDEDSKNQRQIEVNIDVEDLLYDKSWDALIPVVHRIRQYKDYIPGSKISWLIIDVTHSLQYCRIISTHKYIVNFIKFYNSQKP